MNIEEALQWSDVFGKIQSDPPTGDAPALTALAEEVRKLRTAISETLTNKDPTSETDKYYADNWCDPRNKAVKLLIHGLTTDGGHHKQWYLEQVFRALCEDAYVDVARLEFQWEEGIAP